MLFLLFPCSVRFNRLPGTIGCLPPLPLAPVEALVSLLIAPGLGEWGVLYNRPIPPSHASNIFPGPPQRLPGVVSDLGGGPEARRAGWRHSGQDLDRQVRRGTALAPGRRRHPGRLRRNTPGRQRLHGAPRTPGDGCQGLSDCGRVPPPPKPNPSYALVPRTLPSRLRTSRFPQIALLVAATCSSTPFAIAPSRIRRILHCSSAWQSCFQTPKPIDCPSTYSLQTRVSINHIPCRARSQARCWKRARSGARTSSLRRRVSVSSPGRRIDCRSKSPKPAPVSAGSTGCPTTPTSRSGDWTETGRRPLLGLVFASIPSRSLRR